MGADLAHVTGRGNHMKSRMKRRAHVRASAIAPILFISSLLLFQNCAATGATDLSTSSVSSDLLINASKIECRFVGPGVLSDRIRSTLGIAAGDVPSLDTNGNPTTAMRLQSQLETLGQADVASGRLEDASCGTTKFKAAIEIMMDACGRALQNPSVRAQLFPSGFNDLKPIYRALVGRIPTLYETATLSEIPQDLPNREAVACAAVATSFESLIRI